MSQMQGFQATSRKLATSTPLDVAVVDANGDPITSFGGGTQYTEGDTDASITGTAVMWEDAADSLRPVSAAKPLPVNIVAGSSSGTEYTEGDTDASITGTAMLMEGAADALVPVQGTAADGLLVNLGANNDVTVSGVSTSAKQDTIIGHVDGIEGLLTTIDADTSVLAGVDFATGADVASLGVTGGGAEATALRVTIASDSTGVVSIDDNGGAITVDGTVTADTELTTADLDTGGGTDTRAVVGIVGSASGGGQLIPGSSTDGLLVNLGANNDVTVSGVSTEANQTTIIGHLDGVEGLLTTIDTDTGNIVTSVQLIDDAIYTDGSGTPSKAIGIAGTDGTNPQIVSVDTAGHLQVNPLIGSNSVVTIGAGAVDAGTQRVVTASDDPGVVSLGVIDDWDESDRAKVNPIAGQAGVAAGSGTVGATTQRVVLATDVALPTGSNVIGRTGHDITGIGHGVTTVTTAGTDVVLAGSTACKRVVIQAQTDNTSGIAVGGSGVDATVATGTGIYLNPGDAFELEIDNLNDVYVDSLVNGEGVRYTYFT